MTEILLRDKQALVDQIGAKEIEKVAMQTRLDNEKAYNSKLVAKIEAIQNSCTIENSEMPRYVN